MRTHVTAPTLGLLLALCSPALAQPADAPPLATPPAPAAPTPAVGADQPAPPAPALEGEKPKPKPPPYSVPWKLRPVLPLTVILSDTQFAKYEDAPGNGGFATVQTFLGSYKITPEFAVLARAGFIQNSAPSAPNAPFTNSGAAFLNPVVGGFYGMKFDDLRLGLFLGVALPLGQGGGDNPDTFKQTARSQVYSRAAMDNAMFAVNDLVIFPGVGFAYVKGGLTVQAEVTVLELIRTRGGGLKSAPSTYWQQEKTKTNLTTGLHVGYFVIPELSIGAELHYQRWLNPPIAIEQAQDAPGTLTRQQELTKASIDQMSIQVGPRLHLKLADKIWTRPGIAYERGIDWPMSAASNNYHNVQIHIPVVF